MELKPEHVFSACCTLAVLSLENLAENNTAFFGSSYLVIAPNRVHKFIQTVGSNLQSMNAAVPYLLEKNRLFPGFDNFYQWHESFGALMCYCPSCKKKARELDRFQQEFHTLREFYEKHSAEMEALPAGYQIIHTACTHLSQVSHYSFGPIDKDATTDPIRHRLLSTIRQDMGMPDDTGEERWRINLTLSNAYLSFYQRNIINYSLQTLGSIYLTLKNQLYGHTA